MPNCAVVSTQFDFSRGPRMITDLILLQTARTPHETYNLVIQRELEQLVGPVRSRAPITRGSTNYPRIH